MRAFRRRPTGQGHGAALVLATALLVAPARAGASLRSEVGDLPCSTKQVFASQIERLLARDLPADADVELWVTPEPTGELRVRLRRAGAAYDRLLPFGTEDCPAVPHAVAAIARAWLRQSWRLVSEGVADLPAPHDDAAPSASAATTVVDAPAPGPPTSSAWRVAAAAGAFSSLGAGAHYGVSLGATGEWDASQRWGLAVLGALNAPRSAALRTATIGVRVWQAAALARLSLLPTPAGSFDVLAGPALELLDARLSAPSVARSARAAHPAAFLMLRWSERLTSRLRLVAAACASVRGAADQFYVRDPRADFTVSAVRVGGLLGLGWSFE